MVLVPRSPPPHRTDYNRGFLFFCKRSLSVQVGCADDSSLDSCSWTRFLVNASSKISIVSSSSVAAGSNFRCASVYRCETWGYPCATATDGMSADDLSTSFVHLGFYPGSQKQAWPMSRHNLPKDGPASKSSTGKKNASVPICCVQILDTLRVASPEFCGFP